MVLKCVELNENNISPMDMSRSMRWYMEEKRVFNLFIIQMRMEDETTEIIAEVEQIIPNVLEIAIRSSLLEYSSSRGIGFSSWACIAISVISMSR